MPVQHDMGLSGKLVGSVKVWWRRTTQRRIRCAHWRLFGATGAPQPSLFRERRLRGPGLFASGGCAGQALPASPSDDRGIPLSPPGRAAAREPPPPRRAGTGPAPDGAGRAEARSPQGGRRHRAGAAAAGRRCAPGRAADRGVWPLPGLVAIGPSESELPGTRREQAGWGSGGASRERRRRGRRRRRRGWRRGTRR
jgi:hypothetical protein